MRQTKVFGLLTGVLLLALTQAANAQDGVVVATNREACLEAAGQSASASATYTPGVDAYGNPVAPAEGAGGGDYAWLTESVPIVLSVDLAKRYGIGQSGTAFGADAPLGQAMLKNGQVYINGRPLLAEDQAAFLDACERLPSRRR